MRQNDNGTTTTYLAVGLVTAGFVLMFIAWNEAAALDYVQGQVPYMLSGTLPGLALTVTGLTLALIQELRRIAASILDRLERLERSNVTPAAPLVERAPQAPAAAPAAPAAATVGRDQVVATASTVHQPDCRIVAGRTDLTPMNPDDASNRGLTACRICEPAVTAVA